MNNSLHIFRWRCAAKSARPEFDFYANFYANRSFKNWKLSSQALKTCNRGYSIIMQTVVTLIGLFVFQSCFISHFSSKSAHNSNKLRFPYPVRGLSPCFFSDRALQLVCWAVCQWRRKAWSQTTDCVTWDDEELHSNKLRFPYPVVRLRIALPKMMRNCHSGKGIKEGRGEGRRRRIV